MYTALLGAGTRTMQSDCLAEASVGGLDVPGDPIGDENGSECHGCRYIAEIELVTYFDIFWGGMQIPATNATSAVLYTITLVIMTEASACTYSRLQVYFLGSDEC